MQGKNHHYEALRKGEGGLYDPAFEKDSCGLGFVADIHNVPSHDIIKKGLELLCNLTHRGAVGAHPDEGDGVGMLTHIPDKMLRLGLPANVSLPPQGEYGVAMLFLPHDKIIQQRVRNLFETKAEKYNLTSLYWRVPPVTIEAIGSIEAPFMTQWIVGSKKGGGDELERKLYLLRKECEWELRLWRSEACSDIHIASCSSRTIVYKGMMVASAFSAFYQDLEDENYESGVALIHQRFSTNTFPSWSLAQPFRQLCHNGEINTLNGNRHWMAARKYHYASSSEGEDMSFLHPLLKEGLSDTACLDEVLDLLHNNGFSIAHALKMLIPDSWEKGRYDGDWEAFCAYHALRMEAWDGPASVAFCDGRFIGATLDRNGLRPVRYHVTEDGLVVLSSEMGGVSLPESSIIHKGRLEPSGMLLIDLEQNKIIGNDEIKNALSKLHPWRRWYESLTYPMVDMTRQSSMREEKNHPVCEKRLKRAFGYTLEDLSFYLLPMVNTSIDPIGSMGTDTPPAILSHRPRLLYDYFKQRFAQVTNPAIDPIRESLVMSLKTFLGARLDIFKNGDEMDEEGTIVALESPFLGYEEMAQVRSMDKVATLDTTYDEGQKNDLSDIVASLQQQAEKAALQGNRILILSDKAISQNRIAMPALLASSAVHHHLVREGLRCHLGIVVESGECREPHHMALLAGYGADAIHPWFSIQLVRQLVRDKDPRLAKAMTQAMTQDEATRHYMTALEKSLLKIMSKMGIATYRSYCGAQIFDSVGLHSSVVASFFTGTTAHLSGMGLDAIADDSQRRHEAAWTNADVGNDAGGDYAFRVDGEAHSWTPHTVAQLQHGVRGGVDENYRAFAHAVNEQENRLITLRGALTFKEDPIPIEEVEEAALLMRRFATGAMSFGSISREAHSTLAVAMNRLGGKSNTGEGGEEIERFETLANGDSMRSAIKQVASGRFGVTAHYLVNGDDIQIKICQGAKPGEGGQLPGHKVDEVIAHVRHSIKGVGLISPPPHHDIYSIEDLAQLIFDLKNVNEHARISVKLASEVGVGVVAAGVAKARSDHITIAGYEGGTGASPLTSIKHAGLPWELGLAETHQTLVLNRLRDRVSLQVDGGFRTGRDVVFGALLGADEFGFATAPLISMGCLMMRKCHLNTCPVGIATQDPVLRKRFVGKPEHVMRYFYYVTEEVRELMALLGFRKFDDMIGRSDRIMVREEMVRQQKEKSNQKSNQKWFDLNFKKMLHYVPPLGNDKLYGANKQDHLLDDVLDRTLIKQSQSALGGRDAVQLRHDIKNTNRATGAMLSGELARLHGAVGLAEDSIHVAFRGAAGQSFGAFLAKGISFHLSGEANDYVGKGLCGGRIVIAPAKTAHHLWRAPHDHCIIGNTILYGATGGELYVLGKAGERFAVRNSGAMAVAEGAGDHCCEYMTGGIVVILGTVGVNMAAGMSGGIAYVYDEEQRLHETCNLEMVTISTIKDEAIRDGAIKDGRRRRKSDSIPVDDWLASPLEDDAWRLYHLVMRHRNYTASLRAQFILDNWSSCLKNFRKITPRDYAQALGQKEAEASPLRQVSHG